MAAAIKWVGSLLSPSKPAPLRAEKRQPTTPTTPVQQPLSQVDEVEYKSAPRSLFSDKPSDYLPSSSKRKFELDFDDPRSQKKTKMETLASSKRKHDFGFESEFETPQKKNKTQMMAQTMPPMPRSAMKRQFQQRSPTTAIKKNVTFSQQPITDSRDLRPCFGSAGQYRGSIFATAAPPPFSSPESSPSTPSTISETGSSHASLSPATKSNTNTNTPSATPAFTDPYNPYWAPTPHNPRPGQWCLPDDMSFYDHEDDNSMIEQTTPIASANISGKTSATPESTRKGYNAVLPNSPETPRPSHAQLPGSATQSTIPVASNLIAQYSSSVSADADAVLKARAAAEKYKPESVGKQASKLSQVTQARSRSTSPSGSTPRSPGRAIDPALFAQDEENAAEEGNTIDYDEWARNLDWPEPGDKIVEDEIFKSEMMQHILSEWTEEDEEQSHAFWSREYDRVVEVGRKAEREGKVLMFV